VVHNINVTLDRDDLFKPSHRQVIVKLEELMRILRERELEYSNYWGGFGELGKLENENRGNIKYEAYPDAFDDRRVPWFKYWEISHILLNSGILNNVGCKCLDLGGGSSIFSYLLAWMGHDTHVVDIKRGLVENGNKVAKEMGWNLQNHEVDISDLSQLNGGFDYVFSLCVMEHLPISDRLCCMDQVRRLLNKDGVFAITFDYLNPHPRAEINSKQAVYAQFLKPSGMELIGSPFEDNGKRYLYYEGKTYTFGALFMRNSKQRGMIK